MRNIIKDMRTPNGDALIDETNDAVRVNLVAGTISGADGALLDGASSSIKATVLDYASSNPLAVRLTDTGGDYVAAGAGTQYTEDAAAAANPIGSAVMLVREDARAGSLTTTDGDNVAARGTNAGELYVKHVDTVAVTQSGTWDEVGINDSGNSITVDNAGTFAAQVTSVPADPFGANADAASATGSISAKLRFIAGTGIPITGTVTVGSHAVTNAGTFATQVDGAALTALQLIDDPVIADDAGFSAGSTKVMMAGFVADEGSTDSVNEDDAGAARMTLDRKQIVTPQPHTSGGLTTFMASGSDGSSILVATAQAVKASAGQLYGYYAYNPEAAASFVHFYNTAAASVTVGTTNPLFTIAIPAGAAANLMFTHGVVFSNAGWSVAATTTAGGNTAPSTGVSLVVWYM